MHCLMLHCFHFVFPTLGNYMYDRYKIENKLSLSRIEKPTVQAYFGWAKPCLCSYCCSRHLWFYDSGRLGRVEIVTLTVGARAKEGKGGGGGEKKKNACPISLFFWETPYAGKRSSWLVRHREVDWYLSINGKSILFIPFPFACNCGKELFRIQKWRT